MIKAYTRQVARGRAGFALVAAALLFVSGCATTNGDIRDPFEGFNRSMYGFNQAVDEAVLKPVATAYKNSLPEVVQTGVRNFFWNIFRNILSSRM